MADRLLSEGSGEKTEGEGDVFLGSENPSFDLAMWVEGLEPATRVVPVYGDLGLVGDRDVLGVELDDARAVRDDKRVAELKAEIAGVTERIEASRVLVRLQEVSASKQAELVEAADGDPEVLAYSMLATAIVEPKGFTVEILKALAEKSQSQVTKLADVSMKLNKGSVKPRLTTPF